ncbi:MAG TPA: NYN domain-containing protein [Candidatus Limnocylindrales bacterium]|nr:NYN domain-containing protein [Candidatus Limnocylindrales bacterium]
MSKNVAVFVDVANIFYAAKAAGVDIDYVTLLKAATAGRDFVRAYAYTGLDPENENQRNFHSFLARSGYKVVSKDIRKYGDGRVKANLDIELVVDMMKTARNLDVAVVVSGDGDFAPAIRAVQEMGVRVEVVSFRGNTSSDLIEVADVFTDITQIAKVEKGSSRSGRRVAGTDEDLSMTEVPEKESEGTGRRRRGGRRTAEPAEPAPARPSRRRRTTEEPVAAEAAAAAGLVVLPGEKLARAGSAAAADSEEPETVEEAAAEAADGAEPGEESGAGEGRRRRRRRRGGRGRGRGRGGETAADGEVAEPAEDAESLGVEEEEAAEEAAPAAPRPPRTGAFGSVWDSQIGVPTTPSAGGVEIDDEDFEEPEIPEYLIAERRGGGGRGRGRGGGRGGRGGRAAYVTAMERERYGRGRGPRLPQPTARPVPQPTGGGSTGGASSGGPRRGGGSDPWSEVPPELEAMIRAQAAQKPAAKSAEPTAEATEAPAADEAPAAKSRTRRTSTRSKAAKSAEPTTEG